MAKLVSVLVGLAVCCGIAQENEKAKFGVVKRLAEEAGQALIKDDYAKIVDLTYPKVVESMGGRDRMIAELDKFMKKFKAQGFAYLSHTVAEPSEIQTEGANQFAVTPITIEVAVAKGKIIAKSYLLGISTDRGENWTFVDGSGIDTPEKRDKLLPKLPAKLKFPDKQKPEFIGDE